MRLVEAESNNLLTNSTCAINDLYFIFSKLRILIGLHEASLISRPYR